jgi:cytochrome P450
MGCPIFGLPFFWGSKDWGAGSFYLTTSNKLGWPRLFKYYFMGCAFVAVSGLKNLQLVLNKEFEPEGIASALHVNELFGRESLAAERSKDRHQFLRRLVGQPLAPAAVTSSIPVLQGMAMDQINCIWESCANGPVLMDRFVTDYTFNIAWKQILGLDLSADEVPDFFRAVRDWISGVVSPRTYIGYRVEDSRHSSP